MTDEWQVVPRHLIMSEESLGEVKSFVETQIAVQKIAAEWESEVIERMAETTKEKNVKKAWQWVKYLDKVLRKEAYEAGLSALRAGFSLPDISNGSPSDFEDNVLGFYRLAAQQIKLNTSKDILISGGMDYLTSHSGGHNISRVTHHELAHHIAMKAQTIISPTITNGRRNSGATGDEYKTVKSQVSEYATTRWTEFDAEVIGAMLDGKKFHKEVCNLLWKPTEDEIDKLTNKESAEWERSYLKLIERGRA